MSSPQKPISTQTLSTLSREQFWQHHGHQWQQSSLSKSAYCRDRGLKYHQFIYWCTRLSSLEALGDQAAERFVPVAVAASRDSLPSTGLRLTLPNGLRIDGIDAQSVAWIGSLIAQL